MSRHNKGLWDRKQKVNYQHTVDSNKQTASKQQKSKIKRYLTNSSTDAIIHLLNRFKALKRTGFEK